jgi:hypothetical protein
MEISLAGWLGAMVGTIVGVSVYAVTLPLIVHRLRPARPQSLEERAASEQRLSVLRRALLAVDIGLFASLGYWFGKAVGE